MEGSVTGRHDGVLELAVKESLFVLNSVRLLVLNASDILRRAGIDLDDFTDLNE